MLGEEFQCYLVDKDADGRVHGQLTRRRIEELAHGEGLIRVAYSSLNYKDAMAATGHPGVAKVFPLVPGIDLAGVVAESGVYEMVAGDEMIVTGFEMGTQRWGGYAEVASVLHEWTVLRPEGLTLRESMILGTAGLTAALCVDALLGHDVEPDHGEIVVTGASGGVGSIAVAILAKLGYTVVAATGKESAREFLENLGAAEVVDRSAVDDGSGRPMLSGRWAGAVDTVGGSILSSVIRATRHSGCVTACGMAAGNRLSMTVYPFILRGVTLAGIDSLACPPPLRHAMWDRLAGAWKPDDLESMATFIRLDELPEKIDAILAGRITGRVVVELGETMNDEV